jgi:hypothetical protein
MSAPPIQAGFGRGPILPVLNCMLELAYLDTEARRISS